MEHYYCAFETSRCFVIATLGILCKAGWQNSLKSKQHTFVQCDEQHSNPAEKPVYVQPQRTWQFAIFRHERKLICYINVPTACLYLVYGYLWHSLSSKCLKKR